MCTIGYDEETDNIFYAVAYCDSARRMGIYYVNIGKVIFAMLCTVNSCTTQYINVVCAFQSCFLILFACKW